LFLSFFEDLSATTMLSGRSSGDGIALQ